MSKRVFLIVLDSMGIGELPDAGRWGDEGSNTLGAIRSHENFDCPNLRRLGLFNIAGVGGGVDAPLASYAAMAERSAGKDTTIGHWEISGLISDEPLPTYPDGFPDDVIAEFERLTGRHVLCNKPYSGTDVIRDYGKEHMRTGDLIVYTSADSVFQIAAHEDIVPVPELYRYCEIARKMLCGKHGVGRVIARPFNGGYPYTRTANRHDFSLVPPKTTMLDLLQKNGYATLSVGKIYDIFAGKSVDECNRTESNAHGMKLTSEMQKRDFNGLCFVNLVDFDSKYGHRNDVAGYASAMTEFDRWLGGFMEDMRDDDVLIITADHGCDPSTVSTDHSREYTPMLIYGNGIRRGVDLGRRASFSDISATVLDMFGIQQEDTAGESFLDSVLSPETRYNDLMTAAEKARKMSYTPYSHFKVGAALLCRDGKVYSGCNIENAAYGPSMCAERTAIFKAVSEGERDFEAVAIVGGKEGETADFCAPCGVCRQVMAEFCREDFKILLGTPDNFKVYSLKEILPFAFTPDDLS